eukprot:CAMPEP_0177629698 /NCGR_PEP_ID=MMETSP0447-20121125/808_1 /TAXON_ID=0 /ORGANISM="Stygamoeba regulata, Strain BSH-02190019" /LENGTH=453 /DNA_ID=CAMNT_0019131039 /DNA_START=25 /DNA_END=1382 /DNA_ORIENTATION=+
MALKVKIKWGKQLFDDIEVYPEESGLEFKCRLYSFTNVPPERQKVMLKGGMLKDDQVMGAFPLKEGQTIMMMGTAEDVKVVTETPTDMEVETTGEKKEEKIIYPHGLLNLGNTCYMNSSLQCLRYIKPLHNTLKGLKPGEADGLATQLQETFSALDTTTGAPMKLLNTFRLAFPQFSQVDNSGHYMQQDAEECFSQLLTALRGVKLPTEGSPPAIPTLFEGEFQTKLECAETDAEPPQVAREKFMKLSCHIGHTTSHLLAGLKDSLQGTLEKTPESLGRLATYKKTHLIARLPPVLVVQFVRFHWRADTKKKAKIGRPVDFPFDLDLYTLCSEDLQKELDPVRKQMRERQEAEYQKALEQRKAAGDVDAKKKEVTAVLEADDFEFDMKNSNGHYELRMVISHKGRIADSGHYVAWVKHSENVWYLFDDEKVSMVADTEVKKLSGSGGADWHIA